MNFQMFKLDLKKKQKLLVSLASDQIVNISWIIKKGREFPEKKKCTSTFLTTPKPLSVRITTDCGKFLKKWDYQTT